MAAKKTCPSCKTEIAEYATICPACKKALEILYWEIRKDTGETLIFHADQAISSIRGQLKSGILKLGTPCHQFTEVLERVEDGKEQYFRNEREWGTLKDFADGEFSLRVLYDPIGAYRDKVGQIAAWVVWTIIYTVWFSSGLIAVGANPMLVIALSLLLILSWWHWL